MSYYQIMAKAKESEFVCSACGNQFGKWSGQCSACGEWNTLKQVPASLKTGASRTLTKQPSAAQSLAFSAAVQQLSQHTRLSTGLSGLDQVLGGSPGSLGVVPASVILLAGAPGVGKSTLLAQLSLSLIKAGKRVLYVSGEESVEQVAARLARLSSGSQNQDLLQLVYTSAVSDVVSLVQPEPPDLVIVDSVQTLTSDQATAQAGSVSQVKQVTHELIALAKQTGVPVILVGHVTKEGQIAGPRLLEHMVDVVLWFEGDPQTDLRLLRGVKNRYGNTQEVVVWQMTETGLQAVDNPSQFFLSETDWSLSGSAVAAVLEGRRAFLLEIQALVVKTFLAMPRRVSSGFPLSRLQTLLAVLEKRLKLRLGQTDVYINVVGGMKIDEPAADLAVCAAVISAYQESAWQEGSVFVGEVGLQGEVRRVGQMEVRLQEIKQMGMQQVWGPAGQARSAKAGKLSYQPVRQVKDLLAVRRRKR